MNVHNDLVEARFRINMGRINGLLKLIRRDNDSRVTEAFQDGARADLFRAIVVFLHATFEDVLRTLARQRIAGSGAQILDKIPLVGTSGSGRAEKFHLGALHAHRDKTVNDLISESVQNYLDKESFSSCGSVHEVLIQMGLDPAPFRPLYGDLERMMKRRHRIVHEADLPSPKESVPSPWTISDDFDLCSWNLTVLIFYAQLRTSVDPTDELQRLYLARRVAAIGLLGAAREKLITLRNAPPESLRAGCQEAITRLGEAVAFLGPPSVDELLVLWRRLKSEDDGTTEEEARARFSAVCRNKAKI